MSFEKVKNHLFYKDDCYFKSKYGNDFDPDYYDMILIKHEVLELFRRDSDPTLKIIILDNIRYLNEIRIVLLINLISILFLLGFLVTFCLLLNSLNLEFGILKSLISVISLLFIVLVLGICFKLITKIEGFKQENIPNENNGKIEKEDLIVLERKTIR